MNLFSLKDLSIIISIKIDSNDRLKNILTLLRYFDMFFLDKEIIIIEQGDKSFLADIDLISNNEIFHYFLHNKYVHNKTKNLNFATYLSTRPFIMMCDADVICPPMNIINAIDKLKKGSHFISPHNGVLVQIKKHHYNNVELTYLIETLKYFPKNYDLNLNSYDFTDFEPLYGNSKYDSTGGCLIYNRRSSILIGGWNENIISYGFEDMEFVYRISKLGYKLEKLSNVNIYHLEHERNNDSLYNNYYRSNENEWEKVISFSNEQLRYYVINGFKEIKYLAEKEIEIINNDNEYTIRMKIPNKIELLDYTILLNLHSISENELSLLNEYLDYLESNYNLYEVIMIEHVTCRCKYLLNKKNIKYFWLGFNRLSNDDVLKECIKRTNRKYIIDWSFESKIMPDLMQRLLINFEKSLSLEEEKISIENYKIEFKINTKL